jgi:hypothetical protein
LSSNLKNRVDRLSSWARGGARVAAILYRFQVERNNGTAHTDDDWFVKAIAQVTDRELQILRAVIAGAGKSGENPLPPRASAVQTGHRVWPAEPS